MSKEHLQELTEERTKIIIEIESLTKVLKDKIRELESLTIVINSEYNRTIRNTDKEKS